MKKHEVGAILPKGRLSKENSIETANRIQPEADSLLTLKDLARFTAYSKIYWYKRISAKRMPFAVYRFGRDVRFKLSEVMTWIDAHKALAPASR